MLIEIIKEIIEKFFNFINEHINAIFALIYFIFSIIGILYCDNENRSMIIKALSITFIGFAFASTIVSEAKIKIKKDQMPKERLTKKNVNGDIYIPENKINQAIIFLGMLEDDLYDKQ